ncbi:MAG: sigma 54-interacting transcriptional regulator [bacterium]|nr:sigma 54-interacting transcriptional regulator [bacterium]MDT8366311.1 sigma 54-interacting transcriptional regulator [bacterium]
MTYTKRISGKDDDQKSRAVLRITEGPGKGTSVEITSAMTIGSRPDSDLRLEDPTVSRKHAEISRTAEGFLLQDLGSTNGTSLNGVRVDRAYLRDGAVVTVGETSMIFSTGADIAMKAGQAASTFGQMVAVSEPMLKAFALLEGLAASNITVLVEGETGTGKELAARAVHDRSPRAERPFVIFDCSTVPGQLMESELFGHAKGAFTGASEARPGAVEEAEGGTLFLDEIGELPLDLQPKLLRLLDLKEFKRVGTSDRKVADVRFVAATNLDLEDQVSRDLFRRDLYFRISAAKVTLLPLRERPGDIPALARYFLGILNRDQGRNMALKKDALGALAKHSWPGNIREMKNLLETAAALCPSDTISAANLPFQAAGSQSSSDGSLAGAEEQAIRDALEKAGGNKRKVARLLGIAPSTLYAKMKKFGLE